MATIDELCEFIKTSGISKVDLSREDIQTIINTLVYDSIIEPIANSMAYSPVSFLFYFLRPFCA